MLLAKWRIVETQLTRTNDSVDIDHGIHYLKLKRSSDLSFTLQKILSFVSLLFCYPVFFCFIIRIF